MIKPWLTVKAPLKVELAVVKMTGYVPAGDVDEKTSTLVGVEVPSDKPKISPRVAPGKLVFPVKLKVKSAADAHVALNASIVAVAISTARIVIPSAAGALALG